LFGGGGTAEERQRKYSADSSTHTAGAGWIRPKNKRPGQQANDDEDDVLDWLKAKRKFQ